MATCVSLSNPVLEQSYKYKVFLVNLQLFPIKIWEILKSMYKNLDYNSDVKFSIS